MFLKKNMLTISFIILVSVFTSFLTTYLIKNSANAGSWGLVIDTANNAVATNMSPWSSGCGIDYIGGGGCSVSPWPWYGTGTTGPTYIALKYTILCPNGQVVVGLKVDNNTVGNRWGVVPLCARTVYKPI